MSARLPGVPALAVCRDDGTAGLFFHIGTAECATCHRQPRFVRSAERVEFDCKLHCGATVVVGRYDANAFDIQHGLYCRGCFPR